jgi:hypothetical protein
MLGSSPVGMAIFNKCNNTLTQFNWMWFAHDRSPSISKENHRSTDLGIPNHINRNRL